MKVHWYYYILYLEDNFCHLNAGRFQCTSSNCEFPILIICALPLYHYKIHRYLSRIVITYTSYRLMHLVCNYSISKVEVTINNVDTMSIFIQICIFTFYDA